MEDQAKFDRVLRLLLLLGNGGRYSLAELADRFELSTRSVSRYLATFRKAGFIVECTDGLYRIPKMEKPFREISDLLHFSEEEAFILLQAIHSIDDTHALKSNLIKKLYSLYNTDRIIETIVHPGASDVIRLLSEAIRSGNQVLLRQYRSSHGNIIRDRLIEPFDFTTNYIAVWAYDPESGHCKLFKTSRISTVQPLNHPWKHASHHAKTPEDVFRISSAEQFPVTLRLTLRARNLLTEEYPLSEKHLTLIDDNFWQFKASVCGFEGVGRFVMGLPEEVYVIESDDFKSYLKNQVRKLQEIF